MSTKTVYELMRLHDASSGAWMATQYRGSARGAVQDAKDADATLRAALQEVVAHAEIGRRLMAQRWIWEDGKDMEPCGRYWLSIAVDTRKGRPSLPDVITAMQQAPEQETS